MDFQVVLFDLDGTLADSLPLILNTNERVFLELGIPWQAEAVLEMIGLGLAEIARRFAGDRADEFVRLYRSHLYQDYDRLMRPFPWIVDGLTALGQLGLRLGVVTSKGREATGRTLSCAGLTGFFEVVVTADDTPTLKPQPDPVLRAMEIMGVAPPVCAYIGDSPYDILAGRAAGTFTAGVTWGASTAERLAAYGPDIVFSDWRRLEDFFRERSRRSPDRR